jgi:hypothetical protein
MCFQIVLNSFESVVCEGSVSRTQYRATSFQCLLRRQVSSVLDFLIAPTQRFSTLQASSLRPCHSRHSTRVQATCPICSLYVYIRTSEWLLVCKRVHWVHVCSRVSNILCRLSLCLHSGACGVQVGPSVWLGRAFFYNPAASFLPHQGENTQPLVTLLEPLTNASTGAINAVNAAVNATTANPIVNPPVHS